MPAALDFTYSYTCPSDLAANDQDSPQFSRATCNSATQQRMNFRSSAFASGNSSDLAKPANFL